MTGVRYLVLGALCLAFGAGNAVFGAAKVRLVYGESWSPAGRAVKATLSGSEFRSAAKGRYVTEFVNEEGGKQSPDNLGTYKMPAIFLISEAGNCFFVFDNVPQDVSAAYLLKYFNKANAIRLEYEKQGWTTADACGEFLSKMERFVGGPRRVISKGFYADVYEKLKKFDPDDKAGWQRHFTMPFKNHEGKARDCKNADGYEIVEEATWYRTNGRISDGEDFITKLQKDLPTKRLTLEQKQSLLMARFALYREDPERRQEMVSLLKRVAEAGENTLWGTAALGYLNIYGVPPLSTYWGWHNGDFKGPKLNATVKYGVGHSFRQPGKYAIRFVRDAGSSDVPRIESVTLFAGEEEVATLNKPQADGSATAFAFDLRREYRGRLTAMVVKGTAGPEGNSSGKIEIKRNVLRPRKEGR